jgi:medium-chain acyl-[acyl-carrier-protein] hydrolase
MSAWFPTAPTVSDSQLVLFCFPPGGGDVSSFLGWQRAVGDRIAVVPAALPGRGRRIAEPLVPSITDVADRLLQPALRRAPGAVALFGHSMGALIAFELAHRLAAAGRPPALLVVSGSPAPESHPYASRTHKLSDEDFVESVRTLGGMPDGLLDAPEMRELLLPILRSDYAAAEMYRCPQRPVLDVPVLILGGDSDPLVNCTELDLWREVTRGPTEVRVFGGGHFFVVDRLDDVLAEVRIAIDFARALDPGSTTRL